MAGSDPQGSIAGEQALLEFSREPLTERKLTPALRGVLAETATTGVVRYPWPLLRPVIGDLILLNLAEYEEVEHAEIGPAAPLQTAESLDVLRENLSAALDSFDQEPPFTIQRLCEVVLEPRKQYQKLDKLALALEKLLLVTSTMPVATHPPPPPTLADLRPVNECPPAVRGPSSGIEGTSANGDVGPAPKRINSENEMGLATAALHSGGIVTPIEVVPAPEPTQAAPMETAAEDDAGAAPDAAAEGEAMQE